MSEPMNRERAVARYREIRHRLPDASFPDTSVYADNLEALQDEFDVFVLDGFGVLNVGADPVPGAQARLERLRSLGKQLRVLTNGASFPTVNTVEKYRGWQMAFERDEVVSSRDALQRSLQAALDGRGNGHMADWSRTPAIETALEGVWGYAAWPDSDIESLHPGACVLEDDDALYDRVDGVVLLGSGNWNAERQARLVRSLERRRRPVLVGNPDLVAPHAAGFSLEPGLYAHALADAGLAEPVFFGKPFANAFEAVANTFPSEPRPIDPSRIAMVGDTLHTDILGGAAAGWRTVLVSDHGLLRGLDVEAEIEAAGIRPDFVVRTT